ncbi:MAG TPA: serine hydrolase domain-containing protein, partial [Chloroflexia bacterium]|nr:serine hydrolase domain-containing protein [Chloroflexia bacterium]
QQARESGSAPKQPDFSGLKAEVRKAMEQYQVPGVAVGIWTGGQEQVAGFGVTSVEHPLEVTPDTLFQIGSITKTVVATAAMRLVEQGKLNLDTPVQTYVPDLQLADESAARQVTLRHLFSHTAGWLGDYFDDLGPGDDALTKIVAKMAALPQITPLGEIWSYNNAGFYLAGRVLEVVSGQSFETVIQDLVLDPLGMTMSFFFANDVITHRVAIGHENPHDEGNRPRIARPWALPRAAHAAGGITSTVGDQLRYARFHMRDGTAADGSCVLTPQSIALMQTPVVAADSGQLSGLSWFLRDAGGVRLVRHGGATNGQAAVLLMAPAHNFALSVLTNADAGSQLIRDLSRWALQQYLGIAEPEPTMRPASADDLAPYTGHYDAAATSADLRVEDGGLVLQMTPKGGFPTPDSPASAPPPPMRTVLCGEDEIVVLDDPMRDTRGQFLRDPAGQIAWLRIGGRIHKRV